MNEAELTGDTADDGADGADAGGRARRVEEGAEASGLHLGVVVEEEHRLRSRAEHPVDAVIRPGGEADVLGGPAEDRVDEEQAHRGH